MWKKYKWKNKVRVNNVLNAIIILRYQLIANLIKKLNAFAIVNVAGEL